MNILSAEEIYKIEKYAKEKLSIPEEMLMENASVAVSSYIKDKFNNKCRVALLCGPGSNGGDGFAVARQLFACGYSVHILYNGSNSKYSSASIKNLEAVKKLNIPLYSFENINNLDDYDIIVDALFGTGLKRELTNEYKTVIEKANNSNAFKIAVDIPSGLIADIPAVNGTVFKADVTITFSSLKICHTLYPAKKYAGEIICKNISIPENLIDDISKRILISKNNLPKLKIREVDSHKGTFGKAVLLGGSYNMAGALKISSISALHSGCGIVISMHHKNIDRNFISDIPEIITKEYDYKNVHESADFINNNASSFAIGCGMGQSSDAQEFIKNIINLINIPCVMDADALNAVNEDFFKKLQNKNIIITPHLKEFARLKGISIDEVINNKLVLAENFAKENNVTVVLKSADTIVASPEGKTYILNKGNTALAKGGSGDALTGLITGLLAQKYTLSDAVILAVYIIGSSAEIAINLKNTLTIRITDIINLYSEVLNEI